MKLLISILIYIGGLTVVISIAWWLVHLHDLFKRVEVLEINDDIRRNDIIDVKSQIMRMKEKLE